MVAAFDEMKGHDGGVRPAYGELARWLAEVPPDVLDYRRREAELFFRRIGITFAVYGEAEAQERLIPFDVIPRIMAGAEWRLLEKGLTQRVKALNAFIKDIYGAREILRAGVVPDDLVFRNPAFRPEMSGQSVPHDIYVHVAGIDIVRVDAETFYVLEDNARTPSGVSYMLENREIMMRLFPRTVFAPSHRAGRELSGRTARHAEIGGAFGGLDAIRTSCCSRPACSTPPITSIRSLPTSSASSWSRAAICSSRTKSSTCARRKGRSGSTSSTAASTTTFSIRSPSARIPPSACPA